MPPRASYDVIIIGGGHNGLVAAAYLAKAGRRVCVLERRHVLGGASTTEELWPGYKVSTAAYVISLFQPQITRDLKLNAYGLKVLPRSPSSFTPFPDGRSLLMGPEPGLNQREIAKFSTRDAEAYPRYEKLLERVAKAIEPVLAKTAPDLPLEVNGRSDRQLHLDRRARQRLCAAPSCDGRGRRRSRRVGLCARRHGRPGHGDREVLHRSRR